MLKKVIWLQAEMQMVMITVKETGQKLLVLNSGLMEILALSQMYLPIQTALVLLLLGQILLVHIYHQRFLTFWNLHQIQNALQELN